MAFSFRSQHSSDQKHEYGAVITTAKPVTYQCGLESKCGGRGGRKSTIVPIYTGAPL